MDKFKSEADYAYERYKKVGSVTSDHEVPVEDAHAISRVEPLGHNTVVEEEIDPAITNDERLSEDIGIHTANSETYAQPSADWETALRRDELLESDAILAAGNAGLTGSTIDFEDETDMELDRQEEETPLEDVPDADDIQADSPVDPASPELEIVHGTDLLNGSKGE